MRDCSKSKWNSRSGSLRRIYLAAAVVVALIVIGGVVYYLLPRAPSNPATEGLEPVAVTALTPQSLPDVPTYCDNPFGGCAYHWHVHLDIFVNSTGYVVIPDNLGHLSNNLYAIHTHDTSGIIHIETPSNQIFTLAQVFEVWGYPRFNSSNCLVFQNQSVRVYINGQLWTQSVGLLSLHNHDEIAIIIGSTIPSSIPSSYSFPSGY